MDVVRSNCETLFSGRYEWMLIRVSSEPEARRPPDFDQLSLNSQRMPSINPAEVHLPESVYTSIMSVQLIDDVQIIDPALVAVYTAHV